MSNLPLKLNSDKTLQFLFLFGNADGFYISSRYSLQCGWLAAGCSNAHQAIELYIKAILKLNYDQERGHNLIELLKKYEDREKYFETLLKNIAYTEFLKELSDAYLHLRYGESGSESDSGKIIEIIDELAFNLRNIYLKNIKSPSTKIFIPIDARTAFLKDNKFFNTSDLTNNPLAQMGLPIGDDLPKDFFNKT